MTASANTRACFTNIVSAGLLCLCCSGCQAWMGTSPLPSKSGRELKQIEQLAAQDPFPSPEDVGIVDSDADSR